MTQCMAEDSQQFGSGFYQIFIHELVYTKP